MNADFSLSDIPRFLDELVKSNSQDLRWPAIQRIINESMECKAVSNELLMEYAPRLLENNFLRIFALKHYQLEEMSQAMAEEPWIFCFRPIMHRRWLLKIEAKVASFKRCKLHKHRNFNLTLRHALYVYNTLKKESR